MALLAFVPDPPECNVNDPLSCAVAKLEVCTFINATYKCLCPSGFNRLPEPDGRCKGTWFGNENLIGSDNLCVVWK